MATPDDIAKVTEPTTTLESIIAGNPDFDDAFLTAIACGHSIPKIATILNVSASYVYKRIDSSHDLQNRYTRAKEHKAQYLAEQCIEISNDLSIPSDHKRIMLDARKFVSARYYAKMFGDKVIQEHTGSIDFTGISDAEINARLSAKATQALQSAVDVKH